MENANTRGTYNLMPVYRTLLFIFLAFSYTVLSAFQLPKQHQATQPDVASYEKLVIHYRYENPDSALIFAKRGMKLAEENHDEEGKARMLNQMGMIDDNSGRAEASRAKYLKALEIYEKTGNQKGIIKENIRLGAVANRDGNFERSGAHFLIALKLSEKIGDQSGIMESYISLGELYAHQKNLARAFAYFSKAEKLMPRLPFSNLNLNLYADMGAVYREKGDYERAISYYQAGIELSNTPEMMGFNISMTNGLAQVYAKSGAVDKAIVLQQGALLKSRKIKNTIREYISLIALAESYNLINPLISLKYLQEALALTRNKKSEKQSLEVLDLIARLYEGKQNYKEAYLARSLQYTIADSVYFKDITLKISNLQAQYELNKAEANVEHLKFINSRQAMEQRIMSWVIAGVIALLLVLSIYFFKIRKLNQLLNKTNAALTDSNTVKDKLFSVLAHDLRGPLASILNLLGLVNRGWLTEEEKTEMLTKLELHCNVSMETLNLLLRWGQMQLKGVMINQTDINPLQIINRNITLLKESADQKSITLSSYVEPEILVFCDADHLDFLIRNILSNAIKFTPTGGEIELSVKAWQQNKVIFKVKDNGIGISADRLKSVFTVNNVSTSGTNNEKGTSLGLVISKEFVIANEGEIWVESQIGKGSAFFFTLKRK